MINYYSKFLKKINNYFASERKLLILIFATAFLIRLAFLITYQDQKLLRNEYFEQDTKLYTHMAESLRLHEKPDAVNLKDPNYPARLIGLGYPLFLAALFTIFGKSFLMVRIIQVFLGAITCLLLYWLGKEIFDRVHGIAAAVILAFDPFHIYRTGSILTEVIFVFLLTASLLCLYKGINSKNIYSFVLGNVFLIFAGLCRVAAFGMYPFILLWLLLILWRDKLKMIRYVACVLVFSFLIIFLWQFILPAFYPSEQSGPVSKCTQEVNVFNKLVVFPVNLFVAMSSSTHLGITHSKYHDWRVKLYDSTKDLPNCEARKKTTDEFFIFLKKNPALIINVIYQKFINFWRVYPNAQEPGKPLTEFGGVKYKIISLLSYGVILPFFILGLFILVKAWKKMFLLYSLIFIFVCIHVIQCSQIRYRLQIIPAFIIFASFGLIWSVKSIITHFNIMRHRIFNSGGIIK